MERIDVAPDGDIILVVRNTLELRVHSLVLNISSPVFKAMLGPNFAEGQTQGTAADPKVVPLPDDEPEGMRLMCLIFYNQGDLLNARPSGGALLSLAKMADKYQCLQQIRLTMEAWLARIKIINSEDPGAVLHAVFLIENRHFFRKFTEDIVLKTDGFRPRWAPSQDQMTNKLQRAVQNTTRGLQQILESSIESALQKLCCTMGRDHYVGNYDGKEPPAFVDPDDRDMEEEEIPFVFERGDKIPPKCEYILRTVGLRLQALAKSEVWPRPQVGKFNAQFMKAIEDFEIPDDRSVRPCWRDSGEPCNAYDDFKWDFEVAIRKAKHLAKYSKNSVCLDCFKAGAKFDEVCKGH